MLGDQLAKQRAKLVDLLSLAQEKVPYYQKVLPSDIRELVSDSQRWQQVPMLSKQQIQSDWASFLSKPDVDNDPAVRILITSGTTGVPLKIARSKSELRMETKSLWVARRRWHPDIMRWKVLRFVRLGESSHQKMLRLCDDRGVDVSFPALASHMNSIDHYEPDWMYGPPSAMYRLALCYQKEQRSISTLKLIECEGEQLHPHQRELMEGVFGCPVVNQYGCREFWVLSYECPGRSMHAWTDNLLMEVVHQDGRSVSPGETGELVVTSLTNRIMPLIRYRLGDLVQMFPSSCPCRDSHPILTPVEGRLGSLIVTREGTYTGHILTKVFYPLFRCYGQLLREYQVVQRDRDHLDVYIVPNESFEETSIRERLSEAFRRVLPELEYRFVFCSSVPHLLSGKTQEIISYVDSEYVDY